MEAVRKPFQGVWNIIRFNWHFYVLAFGLISALLLVASYVNTPFQGYIYLISALAAASTLLSLGTSYYVYDLSGLYEFKWLDTQNQPGLIVNINAGFDETSALLHQKFENAELVALDFYDPLRHTEVSIKRARAAYPPYPGTRQVETKNLPLQDNSADKIFVILSAHEIRDESERTLFFKELERVVKPGGQIYVTEHLRDFANFAAYNIGFFHFFAKTSWLRVFRNAALVLQQEIKCTPFISTFILHKQHGNTN